MDTKTRRLQATASWISAGSLNDPQDTSHARLALPAGAFRKLSQVQLPDGWLECTSGLAEAVNESSARTSDKLPAVARRRFPSGITGRVCDGAKAP
jgi:hypothetical protein